MKSLAFAALLLVAVGLGAEGLIIIDTTDIKPGDPPKVVTVDGVTISVTRVLDIRRVRVTREGMPHFNEYIVEPADGELRLTRATVGSRVIFDPRRIVVDGVQLDSGLRAPVTGGWLYVCPRDETMVRITKPHSGEIKCPLDGTVMKRGVGQSSQIFLLN